MRLASLHAHSEGDPKNARLYPQAHCLHGPDAVRDLIWVVRSHPAPARRLRHVTGRPDVAAGRHRRSGHTRTAAGRLWPGPADLDAVLDLDHEYRPSRRLWPFIRLEGSGLGSALE